MASVTATAGAPPRRQDRRIATAKRTRAGHDQETALDHQEKGGEVHRAGALGAQGHQLGPLRQGEDVAAGAHAGEQVVAEEGPSLVQQGAATAGDRIDAVGRLPGP